MHHTSISTVLSVVSELQTLLRNILAWYGRLVRLVRTFKQRTSVPSAPSKQAHTVKLTVIFSKN